jgi:hypothetical protein
MMAVAALAWALRSFTHPEIRAGYLGIFMTFFLGRVPWVFDPHCRGVSLDGIRD